MKKRIPLAKRLLPDYSRGEEVMNMVTHIVGGALGLTALVLCLIRSWGDPWDVAGSLVYGVCMICLYTFSSIYHGMGEGTGKKVMQIIDHCTIYFLIAGTYTPILLGAFRPVYPAICWGLFILEWGLCLLAATLTAIDLKKYNAFSMVCYIFMGWAVAFVIPQARQVMTGPGFLWLLWGGIAYTVGAVLYGIGSRRKWFHSVFHIFVVLGSLLQFIAILCYVL